jgi:hypothetical protein
MISPLTVCKSGTAGQVFSASSHGWGRAVNQGRLIVKAVESSTVVAFRALVMLACLIVVPMAAIFGSACPEIVRSLLIAPLMGSQAVSTVCGQNGRASPLGDGFAANPSRPPAADAGMAPRWLANGEATGLGTASASSGTAAPLQPATDLDGPGKSPAEGTLARFDAPADTATSSPWPRFSGSLSDPSGAAGPSQIAAAPASNYPRTSPDFQGKNFAAPAANIPPLGMQPPSGPGPDRFSMLERRLREYGAIYYLLETWGNDGELYRFHCKMAIANNPNCTRHFEATHREAMQAMTQVLEQIEAWRAGRLP